MEAVPRLPMLSFELKISPVCPDFATPIKRFISIFYGEDGDLYDREIMELETLRNNVCRSPRDFTGCSLLKKYYCQVYSLYNRFLRFDRHIGAQCVWSDIYSGHTTIGDLDFELACILYDIGALHAELGANDARQTANEMKISCTHFQCAAWAFQQLMEDKNLFRSNDLSNDVMQFFLQIMLAQAQECILEKSMLDNRKSSIVAKVAIQVVEYYKSAIALLQQSAMNTSSQTSIIDVVHPKLFKHWKKFLDFKIVYYDSISSLYMGNSAEEQQKMGERVAWYESAETKIKESSKLKSGLVEHHPEINDAVQFVADVIAVKLSNAKKENDFIYHEKVTPISQLPEVKGASLVKGIPFNVHDSEISGPDIFARLVPIEAHETASIYSARKDEILRCIRLEIEEKNQELVAYLSSLQLDKDTVRAPKEDAIPDELIDICAELSLNPDCIDEVEQNLRKLDSISEETEKLFKESKQLLQEEEEKEKLHQEDFGKRTSSILVVELTKELAKHEETHKKAIESNKSLWENFEQHKDDIMVMTSSSASKIASILPSNKNIKFDEGTVLEMERLFDKIEEMKKQRMMLEEQLSTQIDQDNVLKLVLAHPKEEVEKMFDNEIVKYDKITSLIKQNLSAQDKILRALTNCNAVYANTRKEIIEVQRNRKTRIVSLLYTHQVFKELTVNSKKGLDFYTKFQGIVVRLNARIRGVSKVQDEERSQFVLAQAKKQIPNISTHISYPGAFVPVMPGSINGPINLGPDAKLKDYLSFMNKSNIRPSISLPPNSSQTIPPSLASTYLANNLNQPSSFVPASFALTTSCATTSFSPSAPPQTPTPLPTPPLQISATNNNFPISSVAPFGYLSPARQIKSSINSEYSPPPSYSQAVSNTVNYPLPVVMPSTASTAIPSKFASTSVNSTPYGNFNNLSQNHFGSQNMMQTANNQFPQQFQQQQYQFSQQQPTFSQASIQSVPNIANVNQQYQQPSSVKMMAASQHSTTLPTMTLSSLNAVSSNGTMSFIQKPQNVIGPHISQQFSIPSANINQQGVSSSINPLNTVNYAAPNNLPTAPLPANPMLYNKPANNITYLPQQINNPTSTNFLANQQTFSSSLFSNQNIPSSLVNNTTNVIQTVPKHATNFQQQQQQVHHSNMMNAPQQLPNNFIGNIQATLEQESKRGWPVMTPISVVGDSSSISQTTSNSNINTNTQSSGPSSTSTDQALPDILSTMSINSNNNNAAIMTKDSSTSIAPKKVNTTIDSAIDSNNEATQNNNHSHQTNITTQPTQQQQQQQSNEGPKDLLSQFDPLFT